MKRVDVATLRAALWAQLALVRARRALRQGRLEDVDITRPPRLPSNARRGVLTVLRRQPHTCLERALVLQAWEAAHGDARDVVIGVRGSRSAIAAHAWLEGDNNGDLDSYEELMRVPAR